MRPSRTSYGVRSRRGMHGGLKCKTLPGAFAMRAVKRGAGRGPFGEGAAEVAPHVGYRRLAEWGHGCGSVLSRAGPGS